MAHNGVDDMIKQGDQLKCIWGQTSLTEGMIYIAATKQEPGITPYVTVIGDLDTTRFEVTE